MSQCQARMYYRKQRVPKPKGSQLIAGGGARHDGDKLWETPECKTPRKTELNDSIL